MTAMISRKFFEAVKLADQAAYKIAWQAGVHPATLSKLLSGAERVRKGDQRVLAVAQVLGLAPEECFASEDEGVRALTGT